MYIRVVRVHLANGHHSLFFVVYALASLDTLKSKDCCKGDSAYEMSAL
jgi:hypothetical protein